MCQRSVPVYADTTALHYNLNRVQFSATRTMYLYFRITLGPNTSSQYAQVRLNRRLLQCHGNTEGFGTFYGHLTELGVCGTVAPVLCPQLGNSAEMVTIQLIQAFCCGSSQHRLIDLFSVENGYRGQQGGYRPVLWRG